MTIRQITVSYWYINRTQK